VSLEVLLIPIGIAAFAAWRGSQDQSAEQNPQLLATRITDEDLLVEALHAVGATRVQAVDGRVTGHTEVGDVTFERLGDNFHGRVTNGTAESTSTLLREIEVAVGGIVQTRSADRIRERATELGLVLITEHADDGTLQFVFEEA
jgi:hypothetical protein